MRDWLLDRSWVVLLAAILVLSFLYNINASSGYLSVNNLVNLFELSIEKVIVVVVMTFVIVAGEIDLSVGSVMVFAASITAAVSEGGQLPFAVGIVIALIACAAVGFTQGWIVTRLGLPSLVVTLAGLVMWRGFARVLVEDRSIGDFPGWFSRLGQDELIGPIPLSVILFAALLATAAVVLHRSEYGRYVYVIGDNADVARFSGVNVRRIRTSLFVCSSFVAGLAGVLFAARLGSVRGGLATGFELEIITVVLLGGVSIFGGSGGFAGVTLAILIFLNVRNGLGLANVDGNVQTGVIGAILILSVLGQNLIERWRDRARLAEPSSPSPAELTTGP